MDSLKFFGIIIGIAGALLGVYFREAIRKAHDRLKIITLIEAHVKYWYEKSIYVEAFKNIMFLAEAIATKEMEAYKKGPEARLEFKKDLKNKLQEAKNNFDKVKIAELIKYLENLSDAERDFLLKMVEEEKESLKNNETFLSAQEAASLPWIIITKIIDTRSQLNGILDLIRFLLISSKRTEKIDEERVTSLIFLGIENGINIFRNMRLLNNYAEKKRTAGIWGNLDF